MLARLVGAADGDQLLSRGLFPLFSPHWFSSLFVTTTLLLLRVFVCVGTHGGMMQGIRREAKLRRESLGWL